MKLNPKIKLVIVVIIFLLLSPILYQMVCWEIYKLNPNIVADKNEYYRTLSNEQLIHKLGIWNIGWFDIALNVLAERKATEAVPVIIKMLKSPFKYHRESAMRALAEIGDERAIEPLMKIVKKGRDNPDYFEVLYSLAKLKYLDIYPYAVEWAKSDSFGAVSILEEIETPNAIPLLEDMKERIKNNDSIVAEYRREAIDKAIAHIKKVNN